MTTAGVFCCGVPFISSDIYYVLRYTRTIWRLNVVGSLNICPWFKRQEELKGQSTAASKYLDVIHNFLLFNVMIENPSF